jgi:hypothetical protein
LSRGRVKRQKIDPKGVAFKMVKELSQPELRVMLYILREVSVGVLILFKELKLKHGIEYEDAHKILMALIEKRYITYVPGVCFNLSEELRPKAVRDKIISIIEAVMGVGEKLS